MVLKAIFFTLLFYLLLSKYRPVQKQRLTLGRLSGKLLARLQGYKLYQGAQLLIKASAADRYLPFLNGHVFLGLIGLIFLTVTVILAINTQNLAISVGFGVLAAFLPRLLLELLKIINIRRVRHNYHGFLTSLIGFFSLSGDVVGSYQNAADYSGEPLKTYVRDAVYKYQRSNIGFETCLDELAQRAHEREVVKLIKFTKLYLAYGGDFGVTLHKLNNQANRLENARLSLYSSAYIGLIAIAVMILINFTAFAAMYNDPASAKVIGSTLTGLMLFYFNLGAIAFGIIMAFGIFRGDIT